MIYKIREFNEQTGQITITVDNYHSPILIDLPLDDENNVLSGNELDQYVNGFIPHAYIARKEKLKNGIKNADKIKSLVIPLPPLPKIEEQPITQPIIYGADSLPTI
jgi:hypothetical protein